MCKPEAMGHMIGSTWSRMSPTLTCPDCPFIGEGSGATALNARRGTITTPVLGLPDISENHHACIGLMHALKPAWFLLSACPLNKEGLTPASNADKLLSTLGSCTAGDGYVTNQAVLSAHPGVSDASVFFNQLLNRPYVNQFIVGPHIYCADVSGSSYATSGQALYSKLSATFGYLNHQGRGMLCARVQ